MLQLDMKRWAELKKSIKILDDDDISGELTELLWALLSARGAIDRLRTKKCQK